MTKILDIVFTILLFAFGLGILSVIGSLIWGNEGFDNLLASFF